MCYRIKVFPLRETEQMSREDIQFFKTSHLFNKANAKIINSMIRQLDYNMELCYQARIILSYDASKLNEQELLNFLT